MNILSKFIILIVLQLVVFKDVLVWIFYRLNDNSDEISSITSLSTIFIIIFLSLLNSNKLAKSNISNNEFNINILSFYFLLYLSVSIFELPLLKGIVASLSLSTTISFFIKKKYFDLNILGLILLSMPILSSVQFFIGYPIRIVVTKISSYILTLGGINVYQESTCLIFNNSSVCVDAPCSGVQMLLTGFYITFVFSFIKKFNTLKSILLLLLSFFIVIFVNIFRATSLFYVESGFIFKNHLNTYNLNDFKEAIQKLIHDYVGILSFIIIALFIMILSDLISKNKSKFLEKEFDFSSFSFNKLKSNPILFLIMILSVFFINIDPKKEIIDNKIISEYEILGVKKLKALPFTSLEKRFISDFAGKTGRFTDGEREIIVRKIDFPTRKLHSASDCYKGLGYKIDFLPIFVDKNGNKWNSFKAVKNNKSFIVNERIYDDFGNSWTDVSSWYWSSLLGKSNKPWTSLVYSKAI